MTLSVKYNAEHGIVETKLSGVVSPEMLRQETEQAIALAQANDCLFFLSDYSEAQADFSIVDVFELPALQTEADLDRCAQIALIAPVSSAGRELAEFYETVCFNRGWSARVCVDRESALAWLVGP
jgi:hypothetical protein